jgi:hypothetical protein
MLTLLWGLATDFPLSLVREQLELAGTAYQFLDQCDVLETDVQLCVGKTVEGSVTVRGDQFDLAEVGGVYLRTYDSRRLAALASYGEGSREWRHAARVDTLLSSWLELTDALVVNRSAAMASNDSKPGQMMRIHELGWSVPETLVTTDPTAARAFWERHRSVVYKSVSSVRSQVSRLSEDHLPRFANITSCPTQFQEYVAGQDFRVHVVGEQVFAAEVVSAADDYRYDTTAEVKAFALSEEMTDRCLDLAMALDLSFAGIDLRRTPDGEWYCFEVNTSPGFSYYEHNTGQPIARAVAQMLAAGGNASPYAAALRKREPSGRNFARTSTRLN